jgi:hypothetical protein
MHAIYICDVCETVKQINNLLFVVLASESYFDFFARRRRTKYSAHRQANIIRQQSLNQSEDKVARLDIIYIQKDRKQMLSFLYDVLFFDARKGTSKQQ